MDSHPLIHSTPQFLIRHSHLKSMSNFLYYVHQINALDTKDELGNLSLEEACERETMTKEFWKTSRIQESNLLQTLQKKTYF